MKTEPKLMSIYHYAYACGISTAAIYVRIKKGLIKTIYDHQKKRIAIDCNEYPPMPAQPPGRKR